MKKTGVFGPQLTNIQIQEKAKRRRNGARGRECAKGTFPLVYSHLETTVREETKGTWFARLRAFIKALFSQA